MDILLVVFCIIIGVALLVVELFLLPGFGIAGFTGFASLAAAVALAYIKLSATYPMAGHITLCASVLLTVIAIYAFYKSRAIEKMALDTTIDSSVGLAEPGKKIENLEKEAQKLEMKQQENENN